MWRDMRWLRELFDHASRHIQKDLEVTLTYTISVYQLKRGTGPWFAWWIMDKVQERGAPLLGNVILRKKTLSLPLYALYVSIQGLLKTRWYQCLWAKARDWSFNLICVMNQWFWTTIWNVARGFKAWALNKPYTPLGKELCWTLDIDMPPVLGGPLKYNVVSMRD